MAYEIKPKDIKVILEIHDEHWEKLQPEMYSYKSAYSTDFWDKNRANTINTDMQITVQTSDAYGYIESYIASLFSRNPGVILKSDFRGRGDSRKASILVNEFLVKHRGTIEDASRLALIYPMSFIKLLPVDNVDLFKRMDMVALNCWDIILDRDAKRYNDMRFCAHRYYLTAESAKKKFGNKAFNWVSKKNYFDKYVHDLKEQLLEDNDDMFKYIEVIEFYDLVGDNIIFWSPQYAMGEKFLEKDMIPFRDIDDKPVLPIIPFYFNRQPDLPIDGYSAMKRIYDQIYETNLIRTFQANAVRKASRQYIVKRGTFDEESMAQVTSGIDGLFIEVDDEDISTVIRPVPQNPTPPELESYYRQVQSDKDKGSILAPFTRGESTRSSATEIAALAAYTSSEVGRLARERDATIEAISYAYVNILAMYMAEGDVKDVIVIDNKPAVVSEKDLRSSWTIFAQDQASTPISESVRKREFIQSIPVLQGLGVPPKTLLAELVRSLGLPEAFIEDMQAEQKAISAAKAGTAGEAIQPDVTELQQSIQPAGPNTLNQILQNR